MINESLINEVCQLDLDIDSDGISFTLVQNLL